MSKKVRIGLAAGLIVLAAVGLFWYLKSQNQRQAVVQKEISIQEAGLGSDNYLTHQNWAGFEFEYPDNLTLTETEVDNPAVYASLEMTSTGGETMTLRIYDDQWADLDDWLNNFEATNVVVDMENVLWADVAAKRFEASTPRQLMTVAVENGVVYRLESPVGSAFFKNAHEHLITSFKFTGQVAPGATAAPAEGNDDNITLIEDTVL